jgi:hypothetical protein
VVARCRCALVANRAECPEPDLGSDQDDASIRLEASGVRRRQLEAGARGRDLERVREQVVVASEGRMT